MNKEVIEKIRKEYKYLSNTNKLIADNILHCKDKKFEITIQKLAKNSYCSNAAVMKFINVLGYKSYSEFRYDLNRAEVNHLDSIVQSFDIVLSYIEKNPLKYSEIVSKIQSAKKVYFLAFGQSVVAPTDFVLKGNKKHANKYILDIDEFKNHQEDDLLIIVSNSGLARELSYLQNQIKSKDVIFVTNGEIRLQHPNIISVKLSNSLENFHNFKEYPKESKYSLLFFFDKLFEDLYV